MKKKLIHDELEYLRFCIKIRKAETINGGPDAPSSYPAMVVYDIINISDFTVFNYTYVYALDLPSVNLLDLLPKTIGKDNLGDVYEAYGEYYRAISGVYPKNKNIPSKEPGYHFDNDWITLCPVNSKEPIHWGYEKSNVRKLSSEEVVALINNGKIHVKR